MGSVATPLTLGACGWAGRIEPDLLGGLGVFTSVYRLMFETCACRPGFRILGAFGMGLLAAGVPSVGGLTEGVGARRADGAGVAAEVFGAVGAFTTCPATAILLSSSMKASTVICSMQRVYPHHDEEGNSILCLSSFSRYK